MATSTILTPPLGATFLTAIPGWRGRTVSGLQAFTRVGSPFTHCGIYRGDGKIIQAEPGGAKERDFQQLYGGQEVLWSDAVIQRHLATERPVRESRRESHEQNLRDAVVEAAVDMVGSPYGLSAYVTVAGAEWGWPGWQRLHNWSVEHGRLICSTLVTNAYRRAGIPLFDDRTVVTPADLYRLDEAWVRHRLAALESRVATIEERLT